MKVIDTDSIWKEFDSFNIVNEKVLDSTNENPRIEPPHCLCDKGPDLIYNNHTVVCGECGIVLEDSIISDEAEWIDYENTAVSGNRCGYTDALFPLSSLSTYISGNNSLSRYNNWNYIHYKEKELYKTKAYLKEIFDENDIPQSLLNDSLYLYKKIKESITNRGSIKQGILAVCIYYSGKHSRNYVSIEKLLKIFCIDVIIFNKCYKIYSEFSNLISNDKEISGFNTTIELFCKKLKLENKLTELNKKIYYTCENMRILYHYNQLSSVASIIFFTIKEMKLDISCDKVSEVCKVSSNTINRICQVISANKDEIFSIIKSQKR